MTPEPEEESSHGRPRRSCPRRIPSAKAKDARDSEGASPQPKKRARGVTRVSPGPPPSRPKKTTTCANKVRVPFWDERLADTYKRYPLPVDPDSASSGSNSSSGCSSGGRLNSWFSTRTTVLPSSSSKPTPSWRTCIRLPPNSTVSIETVKPPKPSRWGRKLQGESREEKRFVRRTRKIRMRLTKEQKKVRCRSRAIMWWGLGRDG